MNAPGPRALVLYDGLCGLCDRSVQWLLRHDRRNALVFAPLQGETAKPYLAAATGRGDDGLDTVVLVERDQRGVERVHVRSEAAFRLLRQIGGAWSALAWFRVLPRALTDAAYRFVSRRRRRWFGRLDACRVPDANTRGRFLP